MAQKPTISASEYIVRLADRAEEASGEETGGKIKMIMRLFVAGYTRKEIIEAGFNRTTVYRQTGEYLKLKKAPALQFHGYALYEARVQKLCEAKGLNREEAVDFITAKDLDAVDDEIGLVEVDEMETDLDEQEKGEE